MSRITKELLRKRAEHNEMMLGNLEEIALTLRGNHQNREFRLILQASKNLIALKQYNRKNGESNQAQRIRISQLEGIEQCESLVKLDLTVNFIGLEQIEESVQCLSQCRLKELYLTGNPCTDWAGCRDYVIGSVDSLQTLDGKDISHSDRIKAKHNLPKLQEELLYAIEEEKMKEETRKHQEEMKKQLGEDDGKQFYTPETRKEMYLQQAREKEEKDRRNNPDKYVIKELTSTFNKDGSVRQCDEGQYKPNLNQWDDPEFTILTMKIPKFLDTQLVDVNVNPKYVSVRIKGKLTQLRLDDEIIVSKSTIQRSEITGELVIKMPKVTPNLIIKQLNEKNKKQQEQQKLTQKQQEELKQRQEQQRIDLLLQKSQIRQTLLPDDDMPDLE
ncbi:hypothetical protein pb186bvf_019564 [Paramecium bursaria]